MKIEFYKNRTLSERFSATAEFVRENRKLYLRNAGYIGIPLALLMGLFMHLYIQDTLNNISDGYSSAVNINWGIYSSMIVSSYLFSLFLSTFTGVILYNYTKDHLPENAGWTELKGTFFAFLRKIFLISILICAILFVISCVLGFSANLLLFLGMRLVIKIALLLFVLLLLATLIILLPFFLFLYYPVFFENSSIGKSIRKSFRLGFKHWASTFGTGMLGILLIVVTTYISLVPYLFYLMVNMEAGGILGYVLSAIFPLATLILSPVFVVFMGFQYTSVVKKEEDKQFFLQ